MWYYAVICQFDRPKESLISEDPNASFFDVLLKPQKGLDLDWIINNNITMSSMAATPSAIPMRNSREELELK